MMTATLPVLFPTRPYERSRWRRGVMLSLGRSDMLAIPLGLCSSIARRLGLRKPVRAGALNIFDTIGSVALSNSLDIAYQQPFNESSVPEYAHNRNKQG